MAHRNKCLHPDLPRCRRTGRCSWLHKSMHFAPSQVSLVCESGLRLTFGDSAPQLVSNWHAFIYGRSLSQEVSLTRQGKQTHTCKRINHDIHTSRESGVVSRNRLSSVVILVHCSGRAKKKFQRLAFASRVWPTFKHASDNRREVIRSPSKSSSTLCATHYSLSCHREVNALQFEPCGSSKEALCQLN